MLSRRLFALRCAAPAASLFYQHTIAAAHTTQRRAPASVPCSAHGHKPCASNCALLVFTTCMECPIAGRCPLPHTLAAQATAPLNHIAWPEDASRVRVCVACAAAAASTGAANRSPCMRGAARMHVPLYLPHLLRCTTALPPTKCKQLPYKAARGKVKPQSAIAAAAGPTVLRRRCCACRPAAAAPRCREHGPAQPSQPSHAAAGSATAITVAAAAAASRRRERPLVAGLVLLRQLEHARQHGGELLAVEAAVSACHLAGVFWGGGSAGTWGACGRRQRVAAVTPC